jgi:hypothetical protein
MKIFEKMPEPIIAAFKFSDNVIWWMMSEGLIHVRHLANVVHVENEAMDLVGNLSLGFAFSRGFFCHELPNLREFRKDVGEEFLAHVIDFTG